MTDCPWRVGCHIEDLQPYSPGKPIEETQREYNLTRIIKLASNENPLGPSRVALNAIQKALPDIHRYPDGSGWNLRKALAERLSVNPDWICLGNGSNEILELLLRTFIRPGDEVLTSWPSFCVYFLVTQAMGVPCRGVPLRDMTYDLEAMAEAVTPATRVVIIANPNNPTGTMVDHKAVTALLDALSPDTLVVFDEAYREYINDPNFPDTLGLLKQGDNRIVITRTFSKIYGLAGLRVGYGIAHPQVVDYLNRVRQPFNVNSLAQAAALAALDDEDHLAASLKINREGKEYLAQAMDRLGLEYIPTSANFLLFRVGPKAGEIYEGMLSRGVIIRPMAGYDLADYLRVTIGTEEELELFVTALTEVLSELGD